MPADEVGAPPQQDEVAVTTTVITLPERISDPSPLTEELRIYSPRELMSLLLKGMLPFFFNRLMGMLRPFMRAIMLSRISEDELAANTAIASTEMVVTILAVSVLNVVGNLISHYRGRRQHAEVGDILLQASLLVFLTNAPLMVGMWFIGDIWGLLGRSPAVTAIIGGYFRWTMWALPLTSLGTVTRQFFTAVGHNRIAMANSLSGLLILAGMGFGLTYLGYGANGYAIASLTQAGIGFVMNAIYLACNPTLRATYGLFSTQLRRSLHVLRELWSRGWPMILQWGSEVVAIFLRSLLAGQFGTPIFTAQGIAGIWEDLSVVLGFSLSLIVGNRVSYHYGQWTDEKSTQDQRMIAYSNLRHVNIVGSLMGLSFSTIIVTLYSVPAMQNLLFRVFSDPTSPENAGALVAFQSFMIGVGVGQVFDLTRNAFNGSARGMRDLVAPAVLNVVGIAAGLGLSYGLADVLGEWALPIGGAVGLALASAGSLGRMLWRQQTFPRELQAVEAPRPGLFSRCCRGMRGIFSQGETQPLLASASSSNAPAQRR